MEKMITKCPACQGELHITALTCPDCGMEFRKAYVKNQLRTI